MVQVWLETHPDEQVIIYSPIIDGIEGLAKELECPYFHGQIPNHLKDTILEI